MHTFSRLSTISSSDIQAIRAKYNSDRRDTSQSLRRDTSLRRETSDSHWLQTTESFGSSYKYIDSTTASDEEEEEGRKEMLCGMWQQDQVVVMAPIFGFFGKVDTKVWYSLILLMLLVSHIIIGSTVFKILETGEIARNKSAALEHKGNFIRYFLKDVGSLRPDNQTTDKLTSDDMNQMLALYRTRCFKSDNAETDARMWNFWTSFDFASTIVSTIGYGGMAPRTETGKLFVIVYTIPGMLIMMSYLNIFSTCILIILRKIIKLIRKLSNQSRMPDIVEQGIVLGISLLFLFTYLVVMATLMHLNNPENDSFVQSLYFYVISMTTIGFGDITLIDHTYLALIRVLFVFCIGLVMVSLVFNAIRELAAAYQRRLVEVSQRIAMKTLAVAKQHRLKNSNHNALTNGEQPLVVDEECGE